LINYIFSAWILLGGILLGHGLIDEQIEEVSRKLAAQPGNQELLLKRAELHRVHEDFQNARADLQKLTQADRPYRPALLTAAKFERSQSKVPQASQAIKRYFELGGNDSEAYREKARIETLQKNHKSAALSWQTFLSKEKSPSMQDYHDGAISMLSSGEPDEARKILKHALAIFPRGIALHHGLAECALTQKDLTETKAIFSKLRGHYPQLLPRLYYQEGKIWQKYHQKIEAQSAYQAALAHLEMLPARKRQRSGFKKLAQDLQNLISP